MENIGEKIFNLRKEKNVSQEGLAEQLKVARPTVSRWENNTVKPTIENIKNICTFFGVGIDYFLSAEEIAALQGVSVTVTEQVAATEEVKKETKFKTAKILTAVVGMVLLSFCIIACGIAAYVTVTPAEVGRYVDTVDTVNYVGIIFLIVGTLAAAAFITLTAIFIKNYAKNRKNK